MKVFKATDSAGFWHGSKTIIHEKTDDKIIDANVKARFYGFWEQFEHPFTPRQTKEMPDDKTVCLEFDTREILTPNPYHQIYSKINTAIRQPTDKDWYTIRFRINDEDHYFKLTSNRPIVVKRPNFDYVLTTPDHLRTSDKLYYANIHSGSVGKEMEKYWPDHIIDNPDDVIKATSIMNNFAELEPIEISDITIQSSHYLEPHMWPHEEYMHLCYDLMTNLDYFVVDDILVPNRYSI